MADRKSSLLSRFWPPSSRRPSTTASTPSNKLATESRTSPTSAAPPPRAATRRKADQPSSASQPSADSKTSSPSLAASPSRLSAQSRSPPQPSTPKRAPSRVPSGSPKQRLASSPKGKLPASPSKELIQPTETISTYEAPTLASKEKDPEPAAPQQPEIKQEVQPASTTIANGPSQDDDDEQPKHSQSSELGSAATPDRVPETDEAIKSLDSSPINGGHEASTTNAEANEETKKEVVESSAPISVYAEQIQTEKQEAIDTKEVLATSQPTERSKNPGAHEKPALPNGANMSEFAKEMAQGDPQEAISSDKPVNVIMLAGENRGASMQMESESSKREEQIHIHRSYKINPDETPEPTTDAEEIPEGKKSREERSMEDQLMEAYVNNNAQGINNSIVFNSSIVEGNPGVHMVFNHLPKEVVQSKDTTSGPETRRAEVNMSHAEKLTYQPTVRRRCLRGLLLETSDSDSENPEKPRRHGCRVTCQKGDTENNIDVF